MMTEERLLQIRPCVKYPCREIVGGTKYRFCLEEQGTVFVFGKGRRSRGWRKPVSLFLKTYDVKEEDLKEKDQTEQWHKRMRRAVKCLEASELWPKLRRRFSNMLSSGMTWEDRKKLNDLYFTEFREGLHGPEYERLRELYPFAFYKDYEGKYHVDTGYAYEISECRLKSMYFGKSDNAETKKQIARALSEKKEYLAYRMPVSYDVTFEYQPKYNKAWYSEEYRGCGNGHYYYALDASTALFVEDD